MIDIVPDKLHKKGFYTPTKAAELMNVSRNTIYRMINDGRLSTAFKPSNHKMMITGRSMVEYIEGVI